MIDRVGCMARQCRRGQFGVRVGVGLMSLRQFLELKAFFWCGGCPGQLGCGATIQDVRRWL